jgi:hypothetical protein
LDRTRRVVIYLDSSAVSFLGADPTLSDYFGRECMACRGLHRLIHAGELFAIFSQHARAELHRTKSPRGRALLKARIPREAAGARITAADIARRDQLASGSLGVDDALHLAIAERKGADFLVTGDARFARGAPRGKVRVVTMCEFFRDHFHGGIQR